MVISNSMQQAIGGSSWIRKMFEIGATLTKQYGADQVFDFSIGNPTFEPPEAVVKAIKAIAASPEKGKHRYMPNAGFPETRDFIAHKLGQETNLAFDLQDIIMCVGAGGGLNVVFKSLCNAHDEIIVPSPYFVEYGAYAANVGAKLITVPCKDNFQLDVQALISAVTDRTKIILLNSPNNPTGMIYQKEDLTQLGNEIRRINSRRSSPVIFLSDEPYRKIAFDGMGVPSLFSHYEHSLVVTSHSKDLGLPGERIGFIAISPEMTERRELSQALTAATRILGFVNAPALMQRVLPLVDDVLMDMSFYQTNRDMLFNHLTEVGFECHKPQGAFYMFPKSPIADDFAFVEKAAQHRLLMVPGSGFGCPGYFRISFCFSPQKVEASLPVFSQLAKEIGL